MSTLTPNQETVYNFLKQFILENGFPPTHKEIALALNFKSANAASCHLACLNKAGVIRIIPGLSRGLQIVDEAPSEAQPTGIIDLATQADLQPSLNSATVSQLLDVKNVALRREILCAKTRFFFEQHQFVQNQIHAEVVRVDGAANAINKTKMYYHALAESMLSGSPMVFWPQISPVSSFVMAFDGQADLQELVDCVRELFNGMPEAYLKDAQARRLERPDRFAV